MSSIQCGPSVPEFSAARSPRNTSTSQYITVPSCSGVIASLAFFPSQRQPTFHPQKRMIKLILAPLILAWILLERLTALFSVSRRPIPPSVTLVGKDSVESGLFLLPPELLYHIVEKLESERAQSSCSVLALSQ